MQKVYNKFSDLMKFNDNVDLDERYFMYYCFNLYHKLKMKNDNLMYLDNYDLLTLKFERYFELIHKKIEFNSKYSIFFDESNFLFKKNKVHYHNMDEIAKKIISMYYEYSSVTDFSSVTEKFKEKYIEDESRIESNETKEEKAGIGIIYDYICNYDFSKQSFNIFVNSIDIHTKLYSKCVGKEFGGALRTEQALLFDTDIEVIPAEEAIKSFNDYIGKSNYLMQELDKLNIHDYIEGCLKIITDLIRIQPFSDGNKRTFRSLFNLMIKRRNLPPVYIGNNNKMFSCALLKAMRFNDYEDLKKLYMRLICDSIVALGLEEYHIINSEKQKKLALNIDKC